MPGVRKDRIASGDELERGEIRGQVVGTRNLHAREIVESAIGLRVPADAVKSRPHESGNTVSLRNEAFPLLRNAHAGFHKGPSMTVRDVPEKLTRAPLELGVNPAASSRMPALTSCSLYLPMAVSNSVLGISPASESFEALTMTMTFMRELPARWLVDSIPFLPAI